MTSTRTTRVVHCKREPFDIYIGRPSKWGNPFVIGRDGNREQVIEKYPHVYSRPSGVVGSGAVRTEREGPRLLVRATKLPWRRIGGTRRIVANSAWALGEAMGLLAGRSFRNFNQPWSGSAPLQGGKQAEPRG